MRTSAFSAAILTLATFASSVSAKDDFSALLADLSFGDAPSLSEPLAVAEESTVADLKPVPTGITMPGMVEMTPPVDIATDTETEVAAELEIAPRVALQDPIAEVMPEVTGQFNLDEAFALQDVHPSATQLPSQMVGHVFESCHGESCDSGIVCRPRSKPNLPSSSLLQYFRSNACYTNVWDGYNQNCGSHHKHLHGECDCFNKSGKSGCGHSNCASCDAGCDR